MPVQLTQVHSPTKPVLVFVASRRQTRLTALDLISHAAADERPTQFLNMDPTEITVGVFSVSFIDSSHVCNRVAVGLCWVKPSTCGDNPKEYPPKGVPGFYHCGCTSKIAPQHHQTQLRRQPQSTRHRT